jgi:hypothetical protein
MKQDIEFCAYIMDHSCPALLHLEPAEYYVEGEKPGPLKEPEQKADMLQLVQPVILNFEIRKSCTNLVLARLSGLVTLVGRKINAGNAPQKYNSV